MRTGEAAMALGVDRTTIIKWIQDYGLEKYFSPNATGADGAPQRTLTENDLLVLNTIRSDRGKGLTWKQIADHLESGYREQLFPQNAISADPRVVPIQQAEQSARAVATMAERDFLDKQVSQLQGQVEKLEQQLKEAREELRLEQEARREELKLEQQAHQTDIERLTKEQRDLAERLKKEHNEEIKSLLREQLVVMQRIGELENELKRHHSEANNDGK